MVVPGQGSPGCLLSPILCGACDSHHTQPVQLPTRFQYHYRGTPVETWREPNGFVCKSPTGFVMMTLTPCVVKLGCQWQQRNSYKLRTIICSDQEMVVGHLKRKQMREAICPEFSLSLHKNRSISPKFGLSVTPPQVICLQEPSFISFLLLKILFIISIKIPLFSWYCFIIPDWTINCSLSFHFCVVPVTFLKLNPNKPFFY